MLIRIFSLVTFMVSPIFVVAADKFTTFTDDILSIFDLLIGLLFAVAGVLFVWALVKYIIGDAVKDKEAAKETMKWGIIILVVASVFWGIVNILAGALVSPSELSELNTSPVPK